jgi:hypothetical protein
MRQMRMCYICCVVFAFALLYAVAKIWLLVTAAAHCVRARPLDVASAPLRRVSANMGAAAAAGCLGSRMDAAYASAARDVPSLTSWTERVATS